MTKLQEILEYLGESYYPYHEYGDIHEDRNQEAVKEAEQAIEAYCQEIYLSGLRNQKEEDKRYYTDRFNKANGTDRKDYSDEYNQVYSDGWNDHRAEARKRWEENG